MPGNDDDRSADVELVGYSPAFVTNGVFDFAVPQASADAGESGYDHYWVMVPQHAMARIGLQMNDVDYRSSGFWRVSGTQEDNTIVASKIVDIPLHDEPERVVW